MPTTYIEQFYVIDTFSPPPAGTQLKVLQLGLVDVQDNNIISSVGSNGDRIDGTDISQMFPGETVTVVMRGQTVTITGVTFYLADGRIVFTPMDGTRLYDATFVSSTIVSGQSDLSIAAFWPPCFTQGTKIRVPGGEVLIESLTEGDLVETMDNGPQPVRWICRRRVFGRGGFAPVRIDEGALGNARELLVSPQHRILVTGWRAELLFGEPEVLVAAKHLCDLNGVRIAPVDQVEYVHLLFDQHEIVFSEGAASESFYPGSVLLEQDESIRAEIEAIFPELLCPGYDYRAARPILTGREARAMALLPRRSP